VGEEAVAEFQDLIRIAVLQMPDNLVVVGVVGRVHLVVNNLVVRVTKDMVVVLLCISLLVQVGGWAKQVKLIVGVYLQKEGTEQML
jgi:hypothetical protein